MSIFAKIATLTNCILKSSPKRNVLNADCFKSVGSGKVVSHEFIKKVNFYVLEMDFQIIHKFNGNHVYSVYLQKPCFYMILSYNFNTGEITTNKFSRWDMLKFGYIEDIKSFDSIPFLESHNSHQNGEPPLYLDK